MDYKFNDLMVATNPIREVIFESENHFCEIKLAEYNGKWDYGFNYHIDRWSCGGGCSPQFREGVETFDSKESARNKALSVMLDAFKNYKKVIIAINNSMEKQGSLF